MTVDIRNAVSPYPIYSGTPGAGDWVIDCRLSGLAAGANTFTFKGTVNGVTVHGAGEVLTKDTAETTLQAIIPIHCAASEAVVVTVLSSSGSDTAVTASSTIAAQNAKLTSDGLDAISTTAPAGVASNFREMMIQLWRRFFKKADKTTAQLKTYADNGTDVLTTQAITDDGAGNETQGAAS